MRITYIKELENWQEILGKTMQKMPIFMQRIFYLLKKWIGISKKKKIEENSYLKILPYTEEELLEKKKWYQNQLKREENVVLSKNLFFNKKIEKLENNRMIWNGKKLFPFMILETIEYLEQKLEIPIEQMNMALVISETKEEEIQTILQLASKVKGLSIVSNQIKYFQKIEQSLYEEKGIAIKLSNNKKKSLKKEKIIINFDLTQEELLQYQINSKAILVNIKETIEELPKGFSRNSNQSI